MLIKPQPSQPAQVPTRKGTKRSLPIPLEDIATRIVLIRGQRVLIDADLAALYGVDTRRLNEQVRRNADRFPADFMFSLTASEFSVLMSQIATSKPGRGGRRKVPTAFTEHGALMAATILNSARARDVAVYVVRAFVQLRGLLASNEELAHQLKELERRLEHKLQRQDQTIARILDAIHRLMNPPEPTKRRIGFAEPEQRGGS